MPRGRRNANPIDTPAKRRALPAQHEPHWYKLPTPPGAYLGLFKPTGDAPSTWRLRVRAVSRYHRDVLGVAPDELRREGDRVGTLRVLDFPAALERATTRARQILAGAGRPAPEEGTEQEAPASDYAFTRATARTYTVRQLLVDHARALAAEGKLSSAHAVERAAVGPLYAALADLRVADVRGADLLAWRDQLAASAPLGRHRGEAKLRPLSRTADPEVRRKRRVRVNRLVTDLKAARNRIAKRVDWLPAECAVEFDKLTKFRDVGRGRVRPLDADEVVRLLDACETPQFRDLVLGALVTGARYSELARLRVGDYRRDQGKVHFARTKDEHETGREVALSPEGVELFDRLTAERDATAPLFTHSSGKPWGQNYQVRPMVAAVAKAGLSEFPSRPSFHSLRDTFATSLLRSGIRLEVVSKVIGHSSVLLTEKHYARFAESDLDAAARALPRFSTPPASIKSIAERRASRGVAQ